MPTRYPVASKILKLHNYEYWVERVLKQGQNLLSVSLRNCHICLKGEKCRWGSFTLRIRQISRERKQTGGSFVKEREKHESKLSAVLTLPVFFFGHTQLSVVFCVHHVAQHMRMDSLLFAQPYYVLVQSLKCPPTSFDSEPDSLKLNIICSHCPGLFPHQTSGSVSYSLLISLLTTSLYQCRDSKSV